jgi:tetratricopeptide (TPR) repeat protein
MLSSVSPARSISRHWSLVALAALLLGQGAFVAWTTSSPQRHAVWHDVISTPIWPAFADLRIMAHGWNETATGFDPLRMDGDAPSYNYPRLWLVGGNLGLRTDDVVWLGVVTAALFLATVFAVVRIAPGWTRLLAVVLLASPAIGLGLERGNSDLLIFALATPALLADPSARNWRSLGAPWLVVLAGMLKLFPIVLLPACLIRAGRGVWISATVGILVFSGYLIVTHKDVNAAITKTERGPKESYGLSVAANTLTEGWTLRARAPAAESANDASVPNDRQRAAHGIAGALLLATLAGVGWRRICVVLVGVKKTTAPTPEAAIRLFLGGATIFLVTFLFAHSWAYRLLFLIWTLPLLGHELLHGSWRRRAWACAALALVGSVCWLVTCDSALCLWWAHAACFALVPVLVLIAGTALLERPETESFLGKLSQRAVFATLLVAGAVLLAGDVASSFTQRGFSSSAMAETWRLVPKGKTAASNGQLQEAIAQLEAALRLNPDHADAHTYLGAALWQAGRGDDALQHLQRAITLQPRAIKARNTLAGVRRRQRRWDEALAGYRESLAIRPDDIATLNQLGLTCLEAGRPEEARQWLEQAQQLRPDHPETARNLGIVSASLGQPDKAADHFKRALLLKPDYADAELQWGFVLARLGRLPEALEHFQQAVKLAPESGQAHFVLAMALRELGRTTEAETHYREAIRLEPALAPR